MTMKKKSLPIIKIKNISEIIREKRKEMEIGTETMADSIFLSVASYYNREKGRIPFIDEEFIRVCSILGLTLEDFIEAVEEGD